MIIDAKGMYFRDLNEEIKATQGNVELKNVLGQRFIAAGQDNRTITINGTPGNALGAYLNGASIVVNASAQDAVGDTMNDGSIVVHGDIGDAAGYAMRGGKLFIKGNAGYRAGIHMKSYKEKVPVIVIGGRSGSFLGEYQAGGVIIVLGLNHDGKRIVGNFPCTGMHGGTMLLRSDCSGIEFPPQVTARPADKNDLAAAEPHIREYCRLFDLDFDNIIDSPFTVITPDSKNPYMQMYVAN